MHTKLMSFTQARGSAWIDTLCSQGAAACAWRLGPHDVQQSCKIICVWRAEYKHIGHKHDGELCV